MATESDDPLRALSHTFLDSAALLREQGGYARDLAVVTGDARFMVLGELLLTIDQWWSRHEEAGGVPRQALDEISRLLREGIGPVLDATDAADASVEARWLEQEVRTYLTGPDDWVRRGWAKPS